MPPQFTQYRSQAIHPLRSALLAHMRLGELSIALLCMREKFLLGSAEVPVQVPLIDCAGLEEVRVIGIDCKRLLDRCQTFFFTSLFLGDSPV